MKYAELYQNIVRGDYDSKLPYPPYRKDKNDNYADRERHLTADQEMKEARKNDKHQLKEAFTADLRQYIEHELGTITNDQFNAIFDKAWEDGHSSGYSEVLIYADDIIDVVKVFI